MDNILNYLGNALQSQDNLLKLDIYIPDEAVIEAVNLAWILKMPLLLMGEPGCGKTRLAEAVAAELHREKWEDHYFRWDIKSSSIAKEGIYQYDALHRLYDANTENETAKEPGRYVQYGEMYKAFTSPQNGNIPNILLIDEIDKADIDFPNDLLLEIEKGTFFIPELNKRVVGTSQVLIFITSNRERELPAAFLRRCLYQFISFPDEKVLKDIILRKYGSSLESDLVTKAIDLFLYLRKEVTEKFAENDKKPSTSELLNWMEIVDSKFGYYKEIKAKKENKEKLTSAEQALYDNINQIETYSGSLRKIPFRQVLLKTWESNQLFQEDSKDA